jgi:hypothetical protein
LRRVPNKGMDYLIKKKGEKIKERGGKKERKRKIVKRVKILNTPFFLSFFSLFNLFSLSSISINNIPLLRGPDFSRSILEIIKAR